MKVNSVEEYQQSLAGTIPSVRLAQVVFDLRNCLNTVAVIAQMFVDDEPMTADEIRSDYNLLLREARSMSLILTALSNDESIRNALKQNEADQGDRRADAE